MKRKHFRIINLILTAVFIFAAANVGIAYYNYGKADSTYEEMRNEYVSSKPKPAAPNKPLDPDESGNSDPLPPDNNEEQSAAIEVPISVDFEALQARNADIVGWLYCPDTVINYPVVQGRDNDQYLHADLDGRYLYSGTLFVDHQNGAVGEDANYIIYGHNMANHSMFGTILRYKEQSHYDANPILYYLTPAGDYVIELFAGVIVGRDDQIYQPTQERTAFFELMQEYQARSTFQTEVQLQPEDDFVILSTCSYEFDNARFIVIGRLMPV